MAQEFAELYRESGREQTVGRTHKQASFALPRSRAARVVATQVRGTEASKVDRAHGRHSSGDSVSSLRSSSIT